MTPHCTQDEFHVATIVAAGWQDLANNHRPESALAVLHHLNDSVAGLISALDCQGVMAAFLVLAEHS